MARVYATPDDLTAYTGQAAPADATAKLAKAVRFLEANVFRLCWYRVDTTTGTPTEQVVIDALRDAVCAQASWWYELGDDTGAAGAGWGSVQLGPLSMNRSVTAVKGEDSAARQIAPEVWDCLTSPDLTPWHFRLGEVRTWWTVIHL